MLAPKYLFSFLLVTGVPGVVICGTTPATAVAVYGFSGPFAPPSWTPLPNQSIVDESGAPNSITLTGPDDGSGNPNTYTYSIALPPNNYAVAFNWSYNSTDSLAAFDQFGYTFNGSPFINLSDPFGGLSQSGSIKLVFNPGDTFSFAMDSVDNFGGPATTQIFNFSAGLPNEIPDCPCVPVPGPLPILGVGAFLGSIRRLKGLSKQKRLMELKPLA